MHKAGQTVNKQTFAESAKVFRRSCAIFKPPPKALLSGRNFMLAAEFFLISLFNPSLLAVIWHMV
jgi:hypothetical protein